MAILTQKHHSAHHAKTRRLEIILILVVLAAFIAGGLTTYLVVKNRSAAIDSAQSVNQNLNINTAEASKGTITSKLGFELTYNKDILNSVATEFVGDVPTDYKNDEAFEPRSYAIVDIYRPFNDKDDAVDTDFDNSTFEMITNRKKDFFAEKRQQFGGGLTDLQVTEAQFKPVNKDNITYTETKRETTKIGGVEYLKVEYTQKNTRFKSVEGQQPDKTIIYYTVQNERPYAVKFRNLSPDSANLVYFESILNSITYKPPSSDAQLSLNQNNSETEHRAKLDWFGVGAAEAASEEVENKSGISTETIKVVAKNTPAVTQVNTGYCMKSTITKQGKSAQLPQACVYGHGSGFFISEDGYLATNGHVVKLGTAEAVTGAVFLGNKAFITDALNFYYTVVGVSPASAAKFLPEDLQAILTNQEDAIDFVNLLLSAEFKPSDEYSEYAIQLGNQTAVIDRNVINSGSAGPSKNIFGYDEKVVKADLKAVDFNAEDLKTGVFTASDVALLKVSGSNYPVTLLGGVDGLVSGAGLTVIGFPGIAENISDQNAPSKATATKGVVSAVRDDRGNGKKVIQSDVTISEGNSGGPAFDEAGEVVGLATYTLKDPNGGAGRVSLMRDIADLEELVNKSGVKLNVDSKTQAEWDAGLKDFLGAHYTRAIKRFNKVLSEYPPHVLAQEYIDLAQKKKANGEEASDPVSTFAGIGFFAVLVAVGVVVFIRVKHHRKHLPPVGQVVASTPSQSAPNQPAPQPVATPPNPTAPAPQPASPQPPVAPTTAPAPSASTPPVDQPHKVGGVFYPSGDDTNNKQTQ